MGMTWVVAFIAAGVAGLLFGRRRRDADCRADPTGRVPELSNLWIEGLAPGSDGSSDDTRPSARPAGSSGRTADWNA
jgi:hypothetical protein